MKKMRMANATYETKNFIRLLGLFLFVFILCSLLRPTLFLRGSNFSSMARQFPEYGIMSIGMALAMLTGGIDLSIVYTANLSSILAAKLMLSTTTAANPDGSVGIILLICLYAIAIGLCCGLINGMLISKVGIPAILATLGTQQLFWGFAIVISNGKCINGLPMNFFEIGNSSVLGIPLPLLLFAVLAIVFGFILNKTKFGEQLYLLGTNQVASKFAGLNNDRLIITTYACSGVLAAISGLVMMATTNSTKADYGSSYTMQCILIAVMGGVDPNGGMGDIRGLVVVVLILQMLSSTLNMFENLSNFYRDIIWGMALIAVLIINYTINKREQRIR
ncbi:ABC transporter permease [uncultured Sphaerochaeta sp.]|uniref:ABC transporter permease n=1 Tax=uncultured Sphaerochaeta sp. TaxID=886478 RepID=UPI002A0A6D3D|nr:ABC transporter permease [uncultured Sphaerochaeta sp.]